jgi:hypothetical protein
MTFLGVALEKFIFKNTRLAKNSSVSLSAREPINLHLFKSTSRVKNLFLFIIWQWSQSSYIYLKTQVG